jgi:hypothetical protein
MNKFTAAFLTGIASVLLVGATVRRAPQAAPSLWEAYDQSLRRAKYVDLTHTIMPTIPVCTCPAVAPSARTLRILHPPPR